MCRGEDVEKHRVFLTAEWRYLAMLNYEVDAHLLAELVPNKTELDTWNGKTFVSLVGFRFLNTAVCGCHIPFHRNFDEVNLRFYVRREERGEIRRGVAFIREVVPRWAIAAVARKVFNENYVALPMRHSIEQSGSKLTIAYGWRTTSGWMQMQLQTDGPAMAAVEHSEEQFVTEHYWGYSKQSDGGTVEYRVSHPAWQVWHAREPNFEGHANELYGNEFAYVLRGRPSSAFLAEGSEVTVYRGRRL